METPLSRVTRSQALGNNLPASKERKQEDRCALFDISNNSPIVGLAKGIIEKSPGSGYGEALLRGHVKTLLLEEAQSSPDLSATRIGLVTIASPVVEQHLVSQTVNGIFNGEGVITRSLLVDFSEKSECHSDGDDDDGDSVWSIEVNASSTHDDGEEVDALLCEGTWMSTSSVEFEGKHTRFIYDSDEDDDTGDEVFFCNIIKLHYPETQNNLNHDQNLTSSQNN